jgi:hypothetical protein
MTTRSMVAGLLMFVTVGGMRDAAAQPPVDAFADLRSVLKVGQDVIVTDTLGDTQRGELLTISSTELTIRWRSLFRRRERSFREETVRRVQVADSTWNGSLVGLGIGVAVTVIGAQSCDDSAGCYGVLLAAPSGILAGEMIDRARNRVVFVSPGTQSAESAGDSPSVHGIPAERHAPPRVMLAPIFGASRTGATVRLRVGGP